jgi:membrane glycosyltransferase
METHPNVGLIQTMPALVNAESLFGRIQQFANRLYAPIFITGLNFWTQSFGNYWGHNAIIRTEPFMQCCDLPQLPGIRPFGGQILSHDFVEAALLLRENWQVWMAQDLEGSYEEAPQGIIENAQRDRRWCQGNLQHGVVLFARGLRGISRLHLLLGIMGYLASPLWLLFVLTFNWALWFKGHTGLSELPAVRARTPFLDLNGPEHALLIFIICMVVLFLPKVLALLDLVFHPERRRAFGGLRHAFASAIAETFFSALHAPLQMLWHSKFVATILLGIGVHWGPQKRRADGVAWAEAFRQHRGHMLIGLGWGTAVWFIDPRTFWWFMPVIVGMLLSVPLSVLTSRISWGTDARRAGLFLTPEETAPPPELENLRVRMEALEKAGQAETGQIGSRICEAVLDPYVNAVHVSLLRERRFSADNSPSAAPAGSSEARALGEKLLSVGPDALQRAERLVVLSDADTMIWLHRQVWLRPDPALAPWWREAVRRYSA